MKPAFAVIVAVWIGACQALADDDDAARRVQPFNPDAFSSLSRLRDPVIRRLVTLTQEQARDIDAIQDKWADEFQAFTRLPEEQQERAKLRDICDQYAEAAEKCLTDEQREYLRRLTTATYFGVSLFVRVRNERLQKELQLDDNQVNSVETTYEQWLTEAAAMLAQPENLNAPRANQLMNLQPFNDTWNGKAREAFLNLLSEAQRRRFAEIELQFACQSDGPRVFCVARVAEELRLTQEQLQELDQIIRKLPTAPREFQAKREAYKACLKLLTDAQFERWKALLGRPYVHQAWLFPDE